MNILNRQETPVMTDAAQSSNLRILSYAAEYASLVTKHRAADNYAQPTLQSKMGDLLETCRRELEAESLRRCEKVAAHIRNPVRDRTSFDCAIDGAEAEIVRLCYATPPVLTLDNLSGEDLISLADLYEGWSQDCRLDQRTMIELLGWSDGMRMLADAVGADYAPLPLREGAKMSLLKFMANKMRSTGKT
ncbi:hypothetical protein IVB41_09785 [Bradyrhizobium sp. 44]|uniref:hypothetical protein n=1 Tax=Bradyrhizobium sp. 44 TaxID=2782675 RepID=UPI001FF8348E|nr:hypothetical protein [Bradyrhizobium sp. 44]MCK1284222.1 hypothetical protein [Bradyrhizobium sp. 44]